MRSTARILFGHQPCYVLTLVATMALMGTAVPAAAQTGRQRDTASETEIRPDATVESLFVDFLHYARMGRFTLADSYARALLAHPDLDPVKVLEAANKDRKGVETLLILIKNSSIGESAAQVLDLIHQGENERRRSADRIQANIKKLAGDPQQEYFAVRQLAESGEYAIPWMVQTLLDPAESDLWPRVITALSMMGKPAVNPLVMALAVRNDDVRLNLINALGEIGYSQAVPYLRKLIADDSILGNVKTAAARAIERIVIISGRTFAGSPEECFYRLAERYYNEDDAVRADPRLDQANVWYWDDSAQALRRVVVQQRIFGQVMAMRCCEEALRLRSDHAGAIALWLTANIRRESRLGMNVESGDPAETGETDETRPEVFPRALYFAQAAGPRYAHLVLDRAVRGNDSDVALGAIEALRISAGETSLVGTEDYKQPLVRALQFPDQVVRLRAALALGAALPKSQFAGSELVVPLLALAVGQTGREQVLVVDADESNRNRAASALRAGDRDVIDDTSLYRALERARVEFQNLVGIFISTDVADPALTEALQRLRSEFIYQKMPVVILTKPRHLVVAEELARIDPYVEPVDAAADDADLEAAFDRVRARTGQAPLGAGLALSMALEGVETLRRIAVDGRTVYDLSAAEPALIAALSSPEERLQILAASVLALLPTPTAQRAITHVALDDGNTESLRVATFASLAESAKNNGNLLEESQITELVDIAHDDPDLTIRTAASQALGAVNLKTNKASEIIRSYYGG